MKKITNLIVITSFILMNKIIWSQCPFGGSQYPSTTFSNPGPAFVTVSGLIYAGEYQLYSVVAGTQYEWSYCTGDGAANAAGEDLELTLFNNATGVALAYADDVCGVAPKITWTATFTGTVRVLTNVFPCSTNITSHTLVWRSVSTSSTGCNGGVAYSSHTPTCTGAQQTYAPCTYAGEYNTLTLTAGTAYTFGSSVTSDFITITNASNVILTSGTQPINYTPTASGTYRVYIHLNAACGTSTTCRTPWVSCSTLPAAGCNTGTLWTSYTPTCIGTQETISTCNYAGEYNDLTLTAGTSYTFGSSITTDYLTITNSANVILTQGTQPVSYTPTSSGIYRVYVHTNSACGTQNSCRVTTVQCGTIPPPIANDPCTGAITITPGSYTGTTIGATADIAPICGTAADGTGGGVWYKVTGSSPCKSFTVSTCTGTTFDSQIRVFAGSCGALTCVGGNDDFCAAQSQVTWNYTPGTTYYILVHGFGSATGPFTLNLSESSSSTITPTLATLPTLSGECSVNISSAPTGNSTCNGLVTGTTGSPTSYSTQGTYTITWNYNDAAGATATQTQTVIVDDVTAPIPTLASLSPINSSCAVTTLTSPTANDNCAGVITGTNNATFPITSNTLVTWTYNDGNGNTSTQTQQVNVSDIIAPVPTVASLPTISSVCAPITSLTPPTANDNCSGLVTASTTATLPITTNTTVVWTYTDAAGNITTQNQLVQVGDVIAPVPNVTSLSPISSTCGVPSITPPTATDNCSGTINGTTTASFPINTSTLVTWTFTDANGNTTTQQQNVTINDNVAPVPSFPNLNTVTSPCNPVTSLAIPTATDNCSGVITGTTTTAFPITSSTTVTWTYTDASGNATSQTQNIVIGDNQAPIPNVSSLGDLISTCSVTALTPPTATDNCAGIVTATSNVTLPINSSTTINWVYTDAAGNTSTQNQNVVINDNIAPVPTSANLADINSTCNAITSLTAPTANDNCAGQITGTSNVNLPITTSTTITWTFTDAAGNTTTQTQIVNVGDDLAPVPVLSNLTDINASCSITSLTAPTANDNCAGTVTGTTNVTLPITSSTLLTWTYTDGVGNTSTQTQNVVINDNIAPIPSVSSLPIITEVCSVNSLTAPTANDNCAGLITGSTNAVLPITSSTVITWTYNDGNGNTVTQDQNIIISDNIAPIADNQNLSDILASCSVTNLIAPTATDNCSGVITGTTTTALPVTTSTIIVWLFDDGNGNTSTQNQNIIINDVDAPVPNGALPTITEVCEVNSLTPPSANDNCEGAIQGVSNVTFPINSSTLVTWTFTDASNNSSTQTQQITIEPLNAVIIVNGSSLEVSNPLVGATYQWIDCDNNNTPIDGATNSTFTPTVSGNYAVTINYLSCSSTSDCAPIQVNGIDDNNLGMVIYPNPSNGLFTVEAPEKGVIAIYDVFGKLLWSNTFKQGKNSCNLEFLASGNYLIKFKSDNAVSTARITILE
jgi:hypothetical protein